MLGECKGLRTPFLWDGSKVVKRGYQRWCGPVIGLIAGCAIAVTGWSAIGPDHLVYAVVVQLGFMFTGLLLGPVLVDVARARYRVAPVERIMFVFLGAGLLSRFLTSVGWNAVIGKMRGQSDDIIAPRQFLRGTELSETGHGIGLAATVMVAIIAAVDSHPRGAVLVLLTGVIVHAYPIMIQRILRNRIIGARPEPSRSEENGSAAGTGHLDVSHNYE